MRASRSKLCSAAVVAARFAALEVLGIDGYFLAFRFVQEHTSGAIGG